MRSLLNARTLAATAAAAGVALLGASVGGIASVDRELRAATVSAPIVQSRPVAYETETVRDTGDCPRGSDRRDAARQEL